jgi:hypothetical protein
LLDCSLADPEAPGFEPETEDDQRTADALVEKGLAEKNDHGWKLNEAGFQAASQFLSMQFFG